jgi:hypothetical protein
LGRNAVEVILWSMNAAPPPGDCWDDFGLDSDTRLAGARVSTEKAVLGALARRAPEPHPALMVHPVFVGIGLRRTDVGLFAPPPEVS